ncbi:FG-GAP repeat protein [Halovenus halobia]|uniref:FG-GAP repeat protein n=1 Tax=Halovenus halobia TaxID=3396622 RepID=UPI003F5596AC
MDWDRRHVLGLLATSATVGLSSRLQSSDGSDLVFGQSGDAVTHSAQFLSATDPPDVTEELLSRLPDSQAARLTASDSHSVDEFGHSVALSETGSTALVGAPAAAGGTVELFVRRRLVWQRQARLLPDDGRRGDQFGWSVALSGDGTTALVGAPNNDTVHGDFAGAVYVFTRSQFDRPRDSDWQQRAKLVSEDGAPGDAFGTSVALAADGTIALVGTNGEDARTGYVFSGRGDLWRQHGTLTAPDDQPPRFGRSVALTADGSTALLSACGEALGYVFTRTGRRWRPTATLTADVEDRTDADRPVALAADGSLAVIGTPQASSSGAVSRGAAYIFEHGHDGWTRHGPLVLPDADSLDRLGESVAVGANGLVVLVGASGEAEPHGTKAGAVYAFLRRRDGWSQQRKLVADDGGSLDRFSLVALSRDGSTALVGAPNANPTGLRRRGAAYVFGPSS